MKKSTLIRTTAISLSLVTSIFCVNYFGNEINNVNAAGCSADYNYASLKCVKFGSYWNDDTNGDGTVDENDDKQPIKWKVLSENNGIAVLLAEQNIDAMPYSEDGAATWDKSQLRLWLNSTFLEYAFNVSEQNAIHNTSLTTRGDELLNTTDVTSIDKVYIPSLEDMTDYQYGFSADLYADDNRIVINTGYVATKDNMYRKGEADTYWLRNQGQDSDITCVMVDGSINYHVPPKFISGVRPMLQVDISTLETCDMDSEEQNDESNNEEQTLPDNTTVGNNESISTDSIYPIMSNNKDNHNYQNLRRWASNMYSYLSANLDGSYERVEYVNGEIVAETYSNSFRLLSRKVITMELNIFGGVYFGKDCNYIVFGKNNPDESDSVEVVRVVKYDKDWIRIGEASLNGANTYVPFDAGSLRMTENNDYLYIHTSHSMYKSQKDGLHHQANLLIVVDKENMTVAQSFHEVGSFNCDGGIYVSHSFNQFILIDDEGKIKTLDHGDAYPRAVVIGGNGTNCYVMDISGDKGLNDTGVSLGGFEYSDDCYLVAGNSVDQSDASTYDAFGIRNIFVASVDRSTNSVNINWITDYADTDKVSNPHLIKIDNNKFALLWTEDENLKYTFIDGKGNVIDKIYSQKAELSDCKPIINNGKIVWYVTNGTEPVFYSINTENPSAFNKKESTYSIRYVLNGGSNNIDNPDSYIAGTDFITIDNPARDGYDFSGWYYDESFNEKFGFISKMTQGNITLYAKWSAKQQDITNLDESQSQNAGEITGDVKNSNDKNNDIVNNNSNIINNNINADNKNTDTKSKSSNVRKTYNYNSYDDDYKVTKPSKVKSVYLKNKKGRKIIVTWKWQLDVDKFQVQYALNRSFTKAKKTKTVSGYSEAKTISGLKKGKTYYVRVRGYKKSTYGNVYGSWSAVKKVKIKK